MNLEQETIFDASRNEGIKNIEPPFTMIVNMNDKIIIYQGYERIIDGLMFGLVLNQREDCSSLKNAEYVMFPRENICLFTSYDLAMEFIETLYQYKKKDVHVLSRKK